MDLQLKRIQEGRRNDCKRIMHYINSVDFTTLEDKEIRALVMIRELGNGIVNRQRKLATEDDVSRVLKMSIESMAEACGKIVDQISEMSLEDFNEQEKSSLMMILENALGIISKHGVNTVGRHSDLQLVLKGEEPMAVEMSGDLVLQLESGDTEGLAVVEHESGDKEGLAVVDISDLQEGQIGMEMIEHAREPISWPLNTEITQDWITNLMETFKWFSSNKSPSEFSSVMPFPVVEHLISKASQILHQEPNCIKIQCDKDTKVVVVGDLRGQYLDLLTIWEAAGLPSEKQFFVFNGNYVDKSLLSLELFLVLLAWKVYLPHCVYLLRGNHEAGDIAKICGFLEEINCKFPEHGQTVYKKCLEVFAELPLASVIADCVYSTHGGLFRTEKIDDSQSFEGEETQRMKGKKTGRKRQKMTNTLSLGSLDELAQVNRFMQDLPTKGSILTDVLWSDPTMEPGLLENDRDEAGLLWGPDCTETFLKQSKLKVVIRSHEGPDARAGQKGFNNMLGGYSTDHVVESGKLYTLFSASDYLQHTSEENKNKGAYAVLKPPHFETLEFVSFEATKRPEVNVLVDENAITLDQEQGLILTLNVDLDENAINSGQEEGSTPMLNLHVDENGTNSGQEQVMTPIVNMDVDENAINSGQEEVLTPMVNMHVDENATTSGQEQALTPMVYVDVDENAMTSGQEEGSTPMVSKKSVSLAETSDAAEMSSSADGAVGLSSPSSWIVSLADNVDGTKPVQISENSKEPHKANYEYLLNLIGSLKKELGKKGDELEDYKRKHDSSPAT